MPSTKTRTAARKTAAETLPAADVGAPSFLRFYLSAPLQDRLMASLAAIETATDARKHHAELSETLVEVMNEGLDYYFVRTLKLARTGFIIQQSAKLGLAGAQRVMAPVIRQIVSRMEHEQLLSVVSSIRELMR
jgi:hypothetical protein